MYSSTRSLYYQSPSSSYFGESFWRPLHVVRKYTDPIVRAATYFSPYIKTAAVVAPTIASIGRDIQRQELYDRLESSGVLVTDSVKQLSTTQLTKIADMAEKQLHSLEGVLPFIDSSTSSASSSVSSEPITTSTEPALTKERTRLAESLVMPSQVQGEMNWKVHLQNVLPKEVAHPIITNAATRKVHDNLLAELINAIRSGNNLQEIQEIPNKTRSQQARELLTRYVTLLRTPVLLQRAYDTGQQLPSELADLIRSMKE